MGNAWSEDDSRCVAGVLVGGQSSRLGRPKALLLLADGRTLVEHVVSVARQQSEWIERVVFLGTCADLPATMTELPMLEDALPQGGPLAGLCPLLENAGRRWGLLLACDMPLLQPPILERLRRALRAEHDAVAFQRSDRPETYHACCALYHPRLLPAARHELRHGKRSLQGLLAMARVGALTPTAAEEKMLTNLNTPADYDRLRRPTP
jgi:molybdenum cofactor guanylyltransferase